MTGQGKEAQACAGTRLRTGPSFPSAAPGAATWPESPSRQGGAYPCSSRTGLGREEPLSPQPLAPLPALPLTWANHYQGSLSPQ